MPSVVINKIFTKKNVNYLIMLLGIIMGVYFRWAIPDIVAYAIFLRLILVPFPSKYAGTPAFMLLVVTPILIMAGKKDWAEQTAVYAYYFMVMGVLLAIYEFRKEEKNQKI